MNRSKSHGLAGTIEIIGLFVMIAASMAIPFIPAARAVVNDVSISGFAFNPQSITVNVGDSVRWTNNDGVTHTVTSNTGAWTSMSLAPGSSTTIPFSTVGSFGYHCSIHTYMTGTVVVTLGVPEFSSGAMVFIGLAVMMLGLIALRRRTH